MHDFIVKRAVDFVLDLLLHSLRAPATNARAVFSAVFRHAFYRRIFSPEVSDRVNCTAAAARTWVADPEQVAAALRFSAFS